MAVAVSRSGVVRFDEFELDLRSGELSRRGERLLLPDQPFRLLAILIRERGSLMTRDDLRRELWPEGTFVDFERSLNAAVKRLREALGDSATAPRFIETLPRRGYRFIAAVDDTDLPAIAAAAAAAVGAVPADPSSEPRDSPVPAPRPPQNRRAGGTVVFVSGAIAALSVLVAIGLTGGKPDRAASAAAHGPRLTSLGTVRLAALSPDGQHLAYVRTDDVRESLWVRRIDGDTPIPLVGPMDGFFRSLTVGPDGFVYYTLLRPDLTDVPLRRVPVSGGAPERVLQASGGVSISPDGSRYAYVPTASLGMQESRIVVPDTRGGAS